MRSISYHLPEGLGVAGTGMRERFDILSPEALAFIVMLEREFGEWRRSLLNQRQRHQRELNNGLIPGFHSESEQLRSSHWKAGPIPPPLIDRRTELIGPPDARTIIDAMNSDAKVFVADFEETYSPTWENILKGHSNLVDCVRGSLLYTDEKGSPHAIANSTVVPMICPRGLQSEEKHLLLDGKPVSASLFDFGMYVFHNSIPLGAQGLGPYLYLPKIENRWEAAFWNEVFVKAQHELKLPPGTIKATVIIESILAAFEMHEIIHALKDHCIGIACGRWNYIASFIRTFPHQYEFIFGDRSRLSMMTHFLRSFSLLLIQTAHRRGIHAIGGAAIRNPMTESGTENAEAMVTIRIDKEREAEDGHDGTWILHPACIPIIKAAFDGIMPSPNQVNRKLDDIHITRDDLLIVQQAEITELGIRSNVNIALEYFASWLHGIGSVMRKDSIEHAATVEITRSQLWQWVHNNAVKRSDGQSVNHQLYRRIAGEELKHLLSFEKRDGLIPHYATAKTILDTLVLNHHYTEYFPSVAYNYID